jgi:hypothetical protein
MHQALAVPATNRAKQTNYNYRVSYEIVLSFGLTELKAQVASIIQTTSIPYSFGVFIALFVNGSFGCPWTLGL